MTEATAWQRNTAIARIRADQDAVPAPPLERSIESAARYVGAERSVVAGWWKARTCWLNSLRYRFLPTLISATPRT